MDLHRLQFSRIKFDIKIRLSHYLFDPVLRDFQKQIAAIGTKNSLLLRTSEKHFSYKGHSYLVNDVPVTRRFLRLHKSLYDSMESFLEIQKKFVDEEEIIISNFITRVLNSSKNPHDFLKMFPSAVHPVIQDLVETLPTNLPSMPEEELQAVIQSSQKPIQLMKERMALNLLY